ncbi:hypothetical protein ACFL6Y_01490 [Elusimicrobiota bacterium]
MTGDKKTNALTDLSICYLYPFDLGMELKLPDKLPRYGREIANKQDAAHVLYKGQNLGPASISAFVYAFGVGMIKISFNFKGTLGSACDLSINAENIRLDRYTLPIYLRNEAEAVIARTKAFASFIYADRLEGSDEIFRLFSIPYEQEKIDASTFIRKNYKTLFGIVTGEPSFNELSDYALKQESLKNIGYYDKEAILIKRFGAIIYSKEDAILKDLISLALAQFYNLKSSNFFLERSLLRAQRVLNEQPPFKYFWKIPKAYQRLSSEQTEFSKAKIALTESLYSTSVPGGDIPEIDSDWHLRSVHKEILSTFETDELLQAARARLETVDTIYSNLRDHLSTVFFIFLDFVFLAWLTVDLGYYVLLLMKLSN